MNKIKMGKFLRKLRNQKHISIEKLADEFRKEYIEVSPNAISSWENGKTIPDIDKLNFLASFYQITIDDILNGEIYNEIDFNTVYFLHQPDWFDKLFSEEKENMLVSDIIASEAIRTRTRFKALLFKYADGLSSRSENKELLFLLKHYYKVSDGLSINEYLIDIRDLRKRELPDYSFWWEAQKGISPIEIITLSYGNISDEGYINGFASKFIDCVEDWEKDMLLAMIQRKDPIYYDPTKRNSKEVKRYEEQHGKKFDRDQITKDTIRFLINHGACINRAYLGRKAGSWDWYRVIDTLETSHNYLDKPLEICLSEDGKKKFYYLENTERNRFFIKYGSTICSVLKQIGYSYDEIYKMVSENWEVPESVRLRLAEFKKLDVNKDKDYVLADTYLDLVFVDVEWKKYKNEWYNKSLTYQSDKEKFEEELSKGEHRNSIMRFSWVGGIEPNDVKDYVLSVNKKVAYSDFVKERKVNKTKKLLAALDYLNMNDIRHDYFQLGGEEDE